MKKLIFIILIFPFFLFSACKKSNNTTVSTVGVYKSYKQDMSSIHARTSSGNVNGSQITLGHTSDINGTGNVGSIHFENLDPNLDPLREPQLLIDSIRLTTSGQVLFYPNIFEIERKYVRTRDSIFIIPSDTSLDFIRFYPCCTNPTVITDNKVANFYLTQKGAVTQHGFVLFHYNIFVKRNSGSVYGTIGANYVDLNYLSQLLGSRDTLVYVKTSTYFKRN